MSADPSTGTVHPVIEMERAALARWCRGDPSGFLEVVDAEVGYFDPFLAERIDGRPALEAYYESLRGMISAVAWEMIAPRVTEVGEVAILAFRFRFRSSDAGGGLHAWNATEVWRRRPEGWRLLHTHWSFTGGDGT